MDGVEPLTDDESRQLAIFLMLYAAVVVILSLNFLQSRLKQT